jgi:F-type H+-transporting ATPase subunit delta
MNDSKISVRYSRAIFQSALEKNILDKVNKDMISILEICKLAETKELLQNPVIVPSIKTEIFHKIFTGKVEKVTLALVDLIVKNGRESFLPAIARIFISETSRYKGITKSVLTSAVVLDDSVKKQIISMISDLFKTKVELDEVVDPEIIGGFILRVDDSYIDASVRNKLNKVRKELIRNAIPS